MTAAEKAAKRARDQQRLTDRQRGEVSELKARQARETAALIERHLQEEKALAQTHAREGAKLWRDQGRATGGWMARELDGAKPFTGAKT